MTRSSNGWSALIATAVVAVGLAIVWGFVAVWAGSLAIASGPDRYSEFAVGVDGEVYITSRSYFNWEDAESQTLSGKPIDLSDQPTLNFAYLQTANPEPWPFTTAPSWSDRILGGSNQAKPAEAWYLVRDPGPDGAACFEVFDYRTKRRIGYFGKEGMRQSRPPRDEWFRLGAGSLSSKVATTGYAGTGQYASPRYNFGRGLIERWEWLIADGDDLLFIDQQKKTVVKALSLPGLESATTIQSPFGWVPPKIDWAKLREQAGDRVIESLDNTEELEQPIVTVCGVWNRERIVFWNPATGRETAFDLPDKLAGTKSLQAAWWGKEQLLVRQDEGNWGGGPLVGLYWINRQGKVERTEQIELAGQPPTRERDGAWAVTGVVPSPTIATIGLFFAPLADFATTGKYATYGEAFRHWFKELAPPFGAIYVFGLLGAALVWRQHAKSRRDHGWRWALMALLVGPAGVVAYWLHWRGQPHAACDDCDQRVSRRHEACPTCDADWPTPQPLGTEIFA